MVKVKHIYEFKDRTTLNILNEMKEMKLEGFEFVGSRDSERFQDGYRTYYDKYSLEEEVIDGFETSNKVTIEGYSFYKLDIFIESLEKRVEGSELMTLQIKASRSRMKQVMEYLRQFEELEVEEV